MGKRILVVDDDAMNLRMAEFILSKQEYEVLKVASGQECLDTLASQAVDLVLLDIEMPVMNGIQTLENIRSNAVCADIPVMFLTAADEAEVKPDADRLNVIAIIKKPFMPPVLLETVAKAF